MNDIDLMVTGKAIAIPQKEAVSPTEEKREQIDSEEAQGPLFKEEDLLHSEVKELVVPDGDPEFSETPVKAVAIGGKKD